MMKQQHHSAHTKNAQHSAKNAQRSAESAREDEAASRRHTKRHPGVYIVTSRAKDGGAPWLHLKWRDAATGDVVKRSLGTRDRTLAKKAALTLSARLRADRDDRLLRRIAGAPDAPERHTVVAECVMRHQALDTPNGSRLTLAANARALRRLLAFCASAKVVYLDQLTPARLAEFRAALAARSGRGGRPLKASSLASALSPVLATLRTASAAGRLPHMSSDTVRAVLAQPDVRTRKAKLRHGLKLPSPLSVPRLRALLEAALTADARPLRANASACATDIALLLLCGFRRAEAALLRCGDVVFSEEEHATVRVREEIAKGMLGRRVHMRSFSRLGVELLRAVVEGRGSDEWLFRLGYSSAPRLPKRLARYALPVLGRWTVHDLRATCDTYQLSLGRIDLKRTTARIGHSLAQADSAYLEPLDGMQVGAATLEEAMGVEDLLARVIDAERARSVDAPRLEPRRCTLVSGLALQLAAAGKPKAPSEQRRNGVEQYLAAPRGYGRS